MTPTSKKYDSSSSLAFSASLLSIAIAAASYAGGAFAQASEERMVRLEEVVVTARRRAESLQDVPITINAFDEDYLRGHNITSIDDIQNHTPSMHITYNAADTIEPRVAIRGVMPNEARLNNDPSAPMYFADVVMSPSTGTNLSLFDLSMLQVLQGPQGTLFGRNSTAGAILINPKLPGDELGGFVDLTLGNYNMHQTDFGVDVPVTDRLQVRLSGRFHERDGYQTNRNDLPQDIANYGKELWDDNTKALRLSTRWQPTDNIESVTIAEWSDKKSRARAGKAVVTGRSAFEGAVQRNDELSDPYDVRVNIIAPENVENVFASNTTTFDVGPVAFKNILGYRKTRSFRKVDLDGMDIAVIQSRNDGSGDITKAEQISNEFQVLGSAFDDKLDWVVGAYYYLMDGTATQNNANSGGQTEVGDQESESYALFAQGTYNFDERWSLTLGARQSWDKRDVKISRFTGVMANPPHGTCSLVGSDPGCTLSDSARFDSPTWNASLTYHFNEDVMMYGSMGTGYKAGGYNLRASSSAELTPFNEETVTNYELGLKADWSIGDWQIRNSLSIYRMEFEDIQVSVGECIDLGGDVCTVVTVMKNAAEATYQGADLQMRILPSDNLEFNLAYAYIDPEYTSWVDTDSQGNVVDRSDRSFAFQPKHELNASVKYTLPVDPAIGMVSVMGTVAWKGDHDLTFERATLKDPRYAKYVKQDAYHVIDLRLDWNNMFGSAFDASLFVANLENKTRIVSANEQVRENRDLFVTHIYGEPRTFGASVKYSF